MTENRNVVSWIRAHWLLLLIAVQPVLDILAFWTQSESGTAAGLIRLAVMVFLVLIALLRRPSGAFWIAMAVTASVFVLHMLNAFRVGYQSPVADLKYLSRVVYMPVMAICFCTLTAREEKSALDREIVNGILIAAAIEAVVIILSAVTRTFTYTYTLEKLGISGWVIESNRCCHSDILSTMAVFLAYASVVTDDRRVRFLLPPAIFIALITNGTTACFLTLLAVTAGFPVFLLFRAFVTKEKPDRDTRLVLCEMAALFALTILIYPITPRYKMEEIERNSYSDNEQRFVQEIADLGYDIYALSLEEKLTIPEVHDRLTIYYIRFIASTVDSIRDKYDVDRVIRALNGTVSAKVLGDARNMKRLNARFIAEDSDALTRVFGFEIANLHHDYEDLENDWYAIYYYYGRFGLAVYLLTALFFYIRILRMLLFNFRESMTPLNFTLLMCFTLQLGLAWFSGAMLRRPNASIYIALTAVMLWRATILPRKETLHS